MSKVGIAILMTGAALIAVGRLGAESVSMPVGHRHLTLFPTGIGVLVAIAGAAVILFAAAQTAARRKDKDRPF